MTRTTTIIAWAISAVIGIGVVAIGSHNASPAQAQAPKAPIAACVDFNPYYTCADAKAAAGLRSVEQLMGSRAH